MKVACIYHSRDLDGWMSGAIGRLRFEKDYPLGRVLNTDTNEIVRPGQKDDPEELDLIAYDYGWDIPNLAKYDKIWMGDISFPANEMNDIQAKLKENFVWNDHHISAISNPEIKENWMAGLRTSTKAACELTWECFFPGQEMPELVRLLGRYDCFGHKGTDEEQKVLEFQYGARQAISNVKDAYKYLNLAQVNSERVVTDIYEKGVGIYQYIVSDAKHVMKRAFPISYMEHTDKGSILRNFLCVNQDRFNPPNFGIDYHKQHVSKTVWCIENTHEYGLFRIDGSGYATDPNDSLIAKFNTRTEAEGFIFNGKFSAPVEAREHIFESAETYDGFACFWMTADGKWQFSLYNDNGEVDCSVIAKSFGGGGHKGAAGFISDTLNVLKHG